MKYFIFSVFLCCVFSPFIMAEQVVQLTGEIKNPSAFMNEGKFHQAPIRFYYDHLFYGQKEFVEVPDERGRFSLTIPLEGVMGGYFEYNDHTVYMFWSPGDKLHVSFDSDNILGTLVFKGLGREHNKYLAELDRTINLSAISDEIDRKKYIMEQAVFDAYCHELKAKEQAVFDDYKRINPSVSQAFIQWAKAEIEYRYANRMSSFFYKTADKENDGYQKFIKNYRLVNSQALSSNQYLTFLDNHLRQMCLRDPYNLRQTRIRNREPWAVRAFELARLEYSNEILDYALTSVMLNLISAEHLQLDNFYKEYESVCQTEVLRTMIKEKYDRLKELYNSEAPVNANLFITGKDNPLTFEQILNKYKGKVLYIDFWASWCGPCIAEMRYSKDLKQLYKNEDLVFIYMDTDDPEGKWRATLARLKLSGEHYLLNPNLLAEIAGEIEVGALPRYVLIDREGKVAVSNAPRPSSERAKTAINKLLSDKPK